MRLLHVSDLHFGRALGDLSREAEQRALVNEIVAIADEHEVALTLISGDVFEAFTPPAWAEDLFFELLDGLAAGGQRAVAVIAGNHDSALRLSAADPLARRLGIVLSGDVGDAIAGYDGGEGSVRIRPVGTQTVRIEVPGAEAPIVVGLLPYLSEARVARPGDFDELAEGHGDSSRYGERLATEIAARTAYREEGAVHLLAMHQFVKGGASSDSERRLRVGALFDLDVAAIPSGLDYVALGHLHRPQAVSGAASPAVYAGSPMAYSFSEAGQQKRAVLVDVTPGKPAKISSVPLTSGRPLEIWTVKSLEDALDRAAEAHAGPIVEVRANLGRLRLPADGDTLFSLPGVTVVAVRDLHDPQRGGLSQSTAEEPGELDVAELFRELWSRRFDEPPDAETMGELMSALVEAGQSDEPGLLAKKNAESGAGQKGRR